MRIKVSRMKIAVTALAASLAVAGLAGCSSDSADAPAEAGATVSTMFGDVEVPANPQRVVALGWSDAETALALGTQPVGVADWMAFGGKGVGPWIADEFTTDPKILGTMDLSVEDVIALEPDLILWTRSDNTQATYDKLSAIAPTVGPPPGLATAYGTTVEQQTELVAEALGKEAEGKALLDGLDAKFDAAIAANPAFASKTAAVGAYSSDGYGAYVPGDARADFMTRLGFTIPTAITAKATGNFYIPVANENLNLFDADLTVLFPIFLDSSAFANDPLLRAIPSAQQGHLLILDDPALVNAFSSGSVPGLTYAIDNAVPKFASTLGA